MQDRDNQTYFSLNNNDRVINIPLYAKKHLKRQFFLHTVIAIVIGVSVPYFLINFSRDAYSYIKSSLGLSSNSELMSVGNENQGSDDGNGEEYKMVEGDEVPVNPKLSGQYYFMGPDYKVPRTSALAYEVFDVDTGETIIDKNKDLVLPIASISKLITALVAQDNMDMHDTVTVTKSSIDTYGSTGGLRQGEKILVIDLFYPLLMESSNDAAEVLAESYGKDQFIKKMNLKAKELGMTNTSFDESSGLSAKNVSTANDLKVLVEYITEKHPEIWDITRVRQYAIKGHSWGNGSAISRKVNFLGGKNGFTYEANRTTASIFEVNIVGGKRRVGITLLKSNERETDVDALLRFVTKWVGYLPEGQSLQ